jgi:hypothetical protein
MSSNQDGAGWVPGRYAESTITSLMHLHRELAEEKERRIELYRQLLEKEQALAELRMYVNLLEQKLNARTVQLPPARRPEPPPPPQLETGATGTPAGRRRRPRPALPVSG